jgi:hypothetical protein
MYRCHCAQSLGRQGTPAHETVSQLFFDKRILEKDKKARESFLHRHIDMIEFH